METGIISAIVKGLCIVVFLSANGMQITELRWWFAMVSLNIVAAL